jgi:transcriptional regulator with XRE-family HTH domain
VTGEIVSPWCLKLLRSAGEWSLEELAAATGAAPDLLADLEEGRRPLTREAMGGMIARLRPSRDDASTLLLKIPRVQGGRNRGPGLSEDEELLIERVMEQGKAEAWKLLIARVREGRPTSEVLAEAVSLMAEAGILQAATERFLLEVLLLEAERWEAFRNPRPEDRSRGAELWERLERLPFSTLSLVVEGEEYAHWALCEQICQRSAALAAEDARRSLELAELAAGIASRVPGKDGWRSRLRGFALAHVGQARFALGDLEGAAEALREARQLWDEGAPGDPRLLAETRLKSLEACLRTH